MMKNLMALFMANQQKPRDLRVENAGKEATVYIYDVIGGWYGGVDAQAFAQQIDAIDADTINVRINSPGGDVFDGRAIATALKNSKARVVAHIDGLAASSASWIALAADEVVMAQGAFFMIHNSWTMTMGDKRDMTDSAKLLDQIDASFVADYAKRTGQPESQISDWMNDETWFSADDAVKNGFADRIHDGEKATGNTWNLAAYANAPKELVEPQPEGGPEELLIDREYIERHLSLLERIAI
jgi:ATP-dependent Clp protease protease subunit